MNGTPDEPDGASEPEDLDSLICAVWVPWKEEKSG